MNQGLSPLRGLAKLRTVKSRRFSSFDPTGGNDDRLQIPPGAEVQLAEMSGAGIITHMWVAAHCPSLHFLKKLVLRAYWDNESAPSVECPLGDLFGAGHGRRMNYVSLPLQMSAENGEAFNCYFPMPFSEGMRVTVTNEAEDTAVFYYYIDLELHTELESDLGRFHVQWCRAALPGIEEGELNNEEFQMGGVNTDGRNNYTILQALGHGHYVGCWYSVYNLRRSKDWDWYGEGDDMIFIDGEQGLPATPGKRKPQIATEPLQPTIAPRPESAPGANDAWPPTLHGTGTEDYFNLSNCPTQTYHAPYHGVLAGGGPNWTDPVILYRFHIEDPVVFHKSIRVTIEHGHANRRWDDISTVAFWYQNEPHVPFPELPPVNQRLPSYRHLFEKRP